MKNILVIAILIILIFLFVISFSKNRFKKSQGNNSLLLGIGGDVMLGRLVNEQIKKTSFTYPWGNVLPYLKKTDINLINLENAFTKSMDALPKVFNFKSDPENVKVLQEGNIDVVSLANNHSLDFGIEGLKDTLETLDKAGIKHVGAGLNIEQARKPVIIEENGIKIGFIGWTDNEPGWKASENKPGTNYYSVGNIDGLKENIKQLNENVDFVVVTMHWGPNMRGSIQLQNLFRQLMK